jgi:protein-disulfide isomerase
VKRLGVVAGIAAAVLASVLFAAGCGSSRGAQRSNATGARAVRGDVASLLAGIPETGNTLGYPGAPITLEFFGDLQCPYCRQFTLGALASLIRGYVRSGRLKIAYHSLKTATKNPETFRTQQVAALAAGRQNKMWYFVELFYHEQHAEDSGYVTEAYLRGLAKQVGGLNLLAWTVARNDPKLTSRVIREGRFALRAGFTGTPAFLLVTGNRFRRFEPETLTDVSPYVSAIQALLHLDHRRRPAAPLGLPS